jgi:hypothetical protein
MPNFWDSSGYEPTWGGSDDAKGAGRATSGYPGGTAGGGGYAPSGGGGGSDMNDAGAADDPFAYTKGSLLTPWEGKFDGSKYGSGGGGVAEYKPFQYADFNYNAQLPGSFDEKYQNPGDFSYGDYQGPGEFQGVTDKDMKADKGYQFRQDQAMKVLQASKAAQGVLKTGGTAKALQANASNLASQEYGNVYGRKRGEYDSANDNSRFRYGSNRNNAKDSFDTNVNNARQGYQLRQGAWKDNAANEANNANMGFQFATGTYDRNESKARQGYEDEQAHAQAVASAGAAGANRAYDRGLDEYKMARDEFYTNQDRQYNILDHEDMKGRTAATNYAGAQTDLALQRGNAQASGRAGSASAWNNALGNIGNSAVDMGMYAVSQRNGGGYSPSRGGARPRQTGGARPWDPNARG